MRNRAAVPIAALVIGVITTACLWSSDDAPPPARDAGRASIAPDAGVESDGGAVDLCDPEETRCDDECVQLDADRANCGACGLRCASGFVCSDGFCECPRGYDACGGSCVDFASDAESCGACGRTCRSDQQCIDGACACPPSFIECDGRCVDPRSDAANCGGCGVACGEPDVCVYGTCGCAPSSGWFSRIERCGDRCINVGLDPENCGGCGVHCPENHGCIAAMCIECRGLLCDGWCVDTEHDTNHCGSCGNRCDAGSLCASGECVPVDECPPADPSDFFGPSYSICDGRCVDVMRDTSHCGGCGIACAPGEYCFITCTPR